MNTIHDYLVDVLHRMKTLQQCLIVWWTFAKHAKTKRTKQDVADNHWTKTALLSGLKCWHSRARRSRMTDQAITFHAERSLERAAQWWRFLVRLSKLKIVAAEHSSYRILRMSWRGWTRQRSILRFELTKLRRVRTRCFCFFV